jgi:D-arabinose 1-dehydrogenase-like Zn-dependent alcohol dehydrogenase
VTALTPAGAVDGMTLLVHGVLGGVGRLAAQLENWGGATVIGSVRHRSDLAFSDNVDLEGALQVEIATPLPLAQIATAHEIVDAGARARVLLAVEG